MPAALDLECRLCTLPCPEGEVFCCMGCRNVHSILIESGAIREGDDPRETDLFKRSLELGLISNAAGNPARPGVPTNAVEEEKLFHVAGMWCSACAWLIEHVLSQEPAIRHADVFFTSDLLRVRYCPQYLPAGRIEESLRTLGYKVSPNDAEARDRTIERRRELLRLGIAVFLWLNVMTLNLSVYLGGGLQHFLPFLVMGLATPVVFYCGLPILRMAYLGLRQGVARMETLLAIGIVSAYGYSVTQALRGGNHIYFDVACAIVTLVLLGKFVERNAKESTTRAITGLYQMLPVKARVLTAGRARFVAIDALAPDDLFVVKAGERIPADGVVAAGESHVDESIVTGESRPVSRGPGDTVAGGTLNTSGVLEVRATSTGRNSVVGRIVQSVEAALSRRSDIERLADKVARVFVPCVIALAAMVGVVSMFTGLSSAEAVLRAITVLVIACPCALGIATPLAITAAVGAASRRGILISDPRALETVERIDTVLLDKTGTITEGRFSLLEFDPDHLPIVAAVEAYSEHPLGKAVVAQAIDIPPASNIEIRKGRGILGEVDGVRVFCGNRMLLAELSVPIEASLDARAIAAEAQGQTVSFYGWDAQTAGIFVFGDRIRDDARALVADLRKRGMRVFIVSGDSAGTVQAVSDAVEADEWFAEVLPGAKQALVARLQTCGLHVLMVGDGVNDGPALAQADLGIAMGSGASLAMQASHVVLMTSRLDRVTEVFDLARRTLRIVRQNLFWAFFYNVAGISLAVLGRLNPIAAAGAMVISSLFVAWNSSRLRGTHTDHSPDQYHQQTQAQ
ncbi:MAG: cation-translocating P-type ATPase [Bryobacteraceae bacterium]